MKVIIITTSETSSGGSRQALYLAEGMAAKGHDIIFFSPANSELREINPALNWQDLPTGFFNRKKAIEQFFTRNQPVIVHGFHNKGVKLAAFAGVLWRMQGLPVACAAHRGVIYKPNNPLPYILPGIRRFIVNSQACASTLPLLWRKKRVTVVHNSIPESRITPTRNGEEVKQDLKLGPDEKIIGCVANDAPVKGITYLLQAFAELKHENVKLLCVGLSQELWLDECKNLNIEDKVIFVPPTNCVADYMNIMDLFILPSLLESQPNVLLEAMCMGKPAVCSAVGGVPEILPDKHLLCPPKDSATLANRIQLLLDNPDKLKAAAQANLEQSKKFSLAHRIETIEAIYKEILAEL